MLPVLPVPFQTKEQIAPKGQTYAGFLSLPAPILVCVSEWQALPTHRHFKLQRLVHHQVAVQESKDTENINGCKKGKIDPDAESSFP